MSESHKKQMVDSKLHVKREFTDKSPSRELLSGGDLDTGKQLFCCHTCGQKYTHRSSLRRHFAKYLSHAGNSVKYMAVYLTVLNKVNIEII